MIRPAALVSVSASRQDYSCRMAVSLDELTFDNRFTDDLPGDPMDLNQPRQVHHAAYSRVQPKVTASPRLLAHSPEVLADLGLDPQTAETDEFARVFSGNTTLDAMEPYEIAFIKSWKPI